MPASVAVPARQAARYLPAAAHTTSFECLVDASGTLHQRRCQRYPTTVSSSRVALDELSDARACDMCLRMYRLTDFGPYGTLLHYAFGILGVLKRSRRETEGMFSRISALRPQLENARNLYLSELELAGVPESDRSGSERLVAEVDAELVWLSRLLLSSKGRETVFAEVRKSAEWEGLVLDESPALLGFHPYRRGEWNALVNSIVEHSTIREEPRVLLLPRYLVEFVSTRRNAIVQGLQPSVSVEGCADPVIETAAALWDPESSGQLASLPGALKAAREVL